MLRQVHAIPGLIAALVVAILAITGAILSVDPAFDHAAIPAYASGRISAADLAARVAAHYPGVERIVRKPSGTVIVYYSDADASGADQVNPLTGETIAPYAPSAFIRWVTNLHRAFLLGDAGRGPAGLGALAMLVLSISGATLLAARMGGWKRLFGRVQGGGIQRLHVEAGRLAVAGLMLSALTGCYMSLATFGFIPDGMEAMPARPIVVSGGAPVPSSSLPALRSADLTDLRELKFPSASDPTDVFTLITADGTGYVDQATGAMLAYLPNGLARQIYETVFMLHTGHGLWWLALMLGLAALTVPLMAVTGTLIWWKRRGARPRFANSVRAQAADTLILVGSEGNSTWGFAKALHDAMTGAGHRVHTAPMNHLLPAYRNAKRMFVLTSTYGDGAVPASATQFLARLQSLNSAPAFPVAILGFGDRQYPRFCQFAKDVESAMARNSWTQFYPLSTIDRQEAQEFSRWGAEIGKRLGTNLALSYSPVRPRTTSLTLVERLDYGAEVQAPTSILRFRAPEDCHGGALRRLVGPAKLRFEVGDLVCVLPPGSLLPRSYSLGSSSRDGILEICVRKHPGGLCSGFLHALQPGDTVDAFIRSNPTFRPSPGKAPIILVGAGTGVAPLIGLIRNNRKQRPIHLYFGGRDPRSDFLYETEFEGWLADKRVARVTTAFSRVADHAYVQDRIAADKVQLCKMIGRGAQIMVCGGREMSDGVREAVEKMIEPLGLTIMTLKARGRYVEDVY